MNRDLFNKNKKAGNTELENDPNWANDVSVQSIEDKIKQDHKELREALRPLSADDKNPIDSFLSLFSKKEKQIKQVAHPINPRLQLRELLGSFLRSSFCPSLSIRVYLFFL